MSHHIYHTQAIILGGYPRGEGDRALYCYTRELGLVVAHARSLREGRSRLRYTLQAFAHVEIDLVRGRREWKLISAHPIDTFASLWRHIGKRRVIAEHAHLLRRLIHGEERHEVLFDDILSGLKFLSGLENDIELRAAELVMVVRVLSHLGYFAPQTVFAPFAEENIWTTDSLRLAATDRIAILSEVNRALELSHL